MKVHHMKLNHLEDPMNLIGNWNGLCDSYESYKTLISNKLIMWAKGAQVRIDLITLLTYKIIDISSIRISKSSNQ